MHSLEVPAFAVLHTDNTGEQTHCLGVDQRAKCDTACALQETSWKVPPEIARKVAAPRLTPENAAILDRIRATSGTSHLRADLQGEGSA